MEPEQHTIVANIEDVSKINKENQQADDKMTSQIHREQLVTLTIICYINLVNFIDRYTLPGILPLMIADPDLDINNFQAGLLQSAFVVSFIFVAPWVGYLADRYSRKVILAVGLFAWTILSLTASFMKTFESLFALRCFGGIGEGTYCAIGPAIIADLFVGDTRNKMLAIFYFTTIAGSGLGFIAGSGVAALAGGSWNWGLRVTPILSSVSVLLIIFFMREPSRGESEGSRITSTSWKDDLVYLFHNRSYMYLSLGSIAVVFALGAISIWGPQYVVLSRKIQDDTSSSVLKITIIFGIITLVSGILGVFMGAFMGRSLRIKFPSADSVICAIGLFVSMEFFYLTSVLALEPLYVIYILSFLALWSINLNWALVGDVLLYVVIPTRRATASALQILAGHLLGDASSPYIVGAIADAIKPNVDFDSEDMRTFIALQYSLYIIGVVTLFGGSFFLLSSGYLKSDREKAEKAIALAAVEEERIKSTNPTS